MSVNTETQPLSQETSLEGIPGAEIIDQRMETLTMQVDEIFTPEVLAQLTPSRGKSFTLGDGNQEFKS